MSKDIMVFIGIPVTVFLIAIGSIFYMWPVMQTKNRMEGMAIYAKQKDLKESEYAQSSEVFRDAWDNEIKYSRFVDKKYVTYSLTSSGRDGTFGTKDDIVREAVDLNKSRIVGDWLGKKAKEGWKGIKEGWEAPSKFEG